MILNYTEAVLDAHTEAFSDFISPENFDDKAHGGVLLVLDEGVYSVADTLYYTAPVDSPPVYANFTSIQPQIINTFSVSTAAKIVAGNSGALPPNATRAFTLTYSFITGPAELYSNLFRIWEDGTKSLANVPGLQFVLLLQPQPIANGTNSLGLKPGRRDVVTSVLVSAYASSKDDDTVSKGMYDIYNKHTAFLEQHGLLMP